MRIPFSRFLFAAVLFFPIVHFARAADTNPPTRLTIELRDGSRIIGTSAEKFFKFHSTLLGNLKMEVKDIRSVECVSSNLTRLTTANGDNLAVSFVDSEFAVKTSFGKVELPVDSVHKLTVLAVGGPGKYPTGLVGLWSGENEGKDSVGGNDAVLTDITFADGVAGQAFSFNGMNSSIRVPASQSADLGADDGFTVMAWIKPMNVEGLHPIFQWLVNGTFDDNALQLWIGLRPDENGVLRASVPGGEGNCFLVSTEGVLIPNVFQHIALAYDKASGTGTLYVNGVVVAQRQLGSQIVVYTAKRDFWIGPRDDRPGNWSTGRTFSGSMDKIALYNRALSQSEIQAVCAQENHGQPLILPTASTGWQELMQ